MLRPRSLCSPGIGKRLAPPPPAAEALAPAVRVRRASPAPARPSCATGWLLLAGRGAGRCCSSAWVRLEPAAQDGGDPTSPWQLVVQEREGPKPQHPGSPLGPTGCPASPLIWIPFSSRIRGSDHDHCDDRISQRGADGDLAGRGQQGSLAPSPPAGPSPRVALPLGCSGLTAPAWLALSASLRPPPSQAGARQDRSSRHRVLGAGHWVLFREDMSRASQA